MYSFFIYPDEERCQVPSVIRVALQKWRLGRLTALLFQCHHFDRNSEGILCFDAVVVLRVLSVFKLDDRKAVFASMPMYCGGMIY